MSKLSYKSLFIIFFFLLIGVVILSRFILPNKTVSASWWNESWSYRKAISINNSASDITNQYVKITLDTTTLISSNKMQNTCNDIRVTDINGNLLNHFIDGNTNYDCNENDTSIYVLVNSIPSSGSTIYVYYGNSSATNIEPKLGSRENPGISCKNIFEHRSDNEGNKIYFITPSGNLADILETECNMTDDSGGWTKVYDGLCTSATSTSRTTGNVLEISSPKLTFNQMRISANNWAYSDIKTTTETATMELTFSGYYQWLHSQPDTPNPDVKFYSAQDGIQDVTFTTTGVMMMGYGNNWRRILPVFYTTNHDSYMYLGATSGVGISGIEWSGSLYNTTMNNTYPAESGKGLTPRSFQEIKVWVRENEITLLTNQSMGSIQSEEIGGGPIAYWKFDEGVGTTAYDSSSNLQNGILGIGSSIPIWQNENQCISNKCLDFNGNGGYISLGNNSKLNNLDKFTMSAWINMRSRKYIPTIINKGSETAQQHVWWGIRNDGQVFLEVGDTAGYRTHNSSTLNWNLNQWYHVSFTLDNSSKEIKHYRDGRLINTVSFTSYDYNTGSTNMFIGRYWSLSPANYDFDGLIDEVKIYPYARTADQIKQDYNSRGSMSGSSVNLGVKSSTAPSLKSSLIAHWKFEEGNGTTTKNSSSLNSAADGILQNGPSWTNDGKFNKGLWLDGLNDYVQVPNQTSLKYTGGDMSFSVWFKPDASDDGGRIISKPWNGSGQYNYGISTGGGSNPSLTFSLVGASSYSLGFNQTIPSDKWSHLTVTLNNNSQVKLYINGKLTNSDTHSIVSWTPSSGDSNLTFAIGTLYPYGGSWAGVTSHAAKGFIDEVKVYNSTITDQEVLQDYNQGAAIQFGSTNQTIGGTTTSLEYCIPGDTSHCAPPVAEWNFEENTGTTAKDTSGNNNNGTFGTGNSAPTWTIGKKNTGAGLNFSGSSQYVTIEDNTSLKPTSNITVEAWFNTNNKTLNQRMVSKTNSGGYSLSINENSACPANTLCFLININGSYYSASYPSSNLSNNTWYHATGSYDGSTVRLFLNGSNIGTTASIINTITQNTAKLCIGSESASTNCYAENGFFSGKIDQVKIYNYARTPAQIAYDYNKGAPIAHWKLDECQGLTAFDSSGSGYTGAINIGPSGTQTSVGTCQIGTSAAWTNGASGKINSSLNFDGVDDYVTMGTVSNIPTGNADRTLSVWVNSAGSGTTDMYPALWIGSTGTHNISAIGVRAATNFLCMTFWSDELDSSIPATSGKWFHLLGTYVGSTREAKLYINGKFAVGKTLGSNLNTPANVYVSSSPDSRRFKGQIDDVRIYNYALTSEQVKTVYNNGAINFN